MRRVFDIGGLVTLPTGEQAPTIPGIYCWYFAGLDDLVPIQGCHRMAGRSLLYLGTAPDSPRSDSDLSKRIEQHRSSKIRNSTLRFTLAAVLKDRLQLRASGPRDQRRLLGDGEAALTAWMVANSTVRFFPTPRPWEIEADTLAQLCPPLNINRNPRNHFRAALKLRRERLLNG